MTSFGIFLGAIEFLHFFIVVAKIVLSTVVKQTGKHQNGIFPQKQVVPENFGIFGLKDFDHPGSKRTGSSLINNGN
jgi:hypothetical protein